MIRVGDKVEWDSSAHAHTRALAELGCGSTGTINGITPKGFSHINDRVESCERSEASILWISIDNDTARIGIRADAEDLVFADEEPEDLDSWEDDLFE